MSRRTLKASCPTNVQGVTGWISCACQHVTEWVSCAQWYDPMLFFVPASVLAAGPKHCRPAALCDAPWKPYAPSHPHARGVALYSSYMQQVNLLHVKHEYWKPLGV
eukprot:scaffold27850_cov19-Tisochrysis_lutea.AAC.3